MDDLKEKRLAFLDETVNHYNLSNRSVIDYRCLYTGSSTSEGCAIGRKIEDKLLCQQLDDINTPSGSTAVSQLDIFNKLPEELKCYGKLFLVAVQKLHDTEVNWSDKGLSLTGTDAYNVIKANITENVIYK